MLSFSLFNLNIMHGRNTKNPIFPFAINRKQIQDNLEKISELIKKHNPDIVTLQEIDQYSVLSGGFDQFDFFREKLNYPHKFFSPSCSVIIFGKRIFVSGNAIFSRHPLENCKSFNFNFSFPTERQGFVIADAKFLEDRVLTICSVHLVWLDWLRLSSKFSRAHQLNLVEKVVLERKNPVIVAGDMNCDFLSKENSLRSFVDSLSLKVYEPKNEKLNTNPSWNPKKRIDWILCSKNINFTSYKTISDRVSDHLAVFATFLV